MIWAILIYLGVSLWVIAVLLIALLRTRTMLRRIPGSVPCKARCTSGSIPTLGSEYARYASSAHWVHDVLLLHQGPFLIRSLAIGVTGVASGPTPIESSSRTRRIHEPVVMRLRTDSGDEIALVCARSDATRLLGPFGRQPGAGSG